MDKKKSPQHVQVPHDMTDDNKLTPTDVLVYAALKARINKFSKTCYPSFDKIASDTGLSKPTIAKSIKNLSNKEEIFINKKGRGYEYSFNTNSRNFEMFSHEMLRENCLKPIEKAYLICSQEYMFKEDGLGKISMSNMALGKLINMDRHTIAKIDKQLEGKGIIKTLPCKSMDGGVDKFLKVFDLSAYHQEFVALKKTVDNHEDRLSKVESILTRELVAKDREIERLKKALLEKEISNINLVVS